MIAIKARRILTGAVAVLSAAALAGCSSGNPLDGGSDTGGSETITVGSAAFSENEILADIYGQALAANGFTVDYRLNIGQREAYIPAIKSGEIDLIPEYTGNLLTFLNPDAEETTPSDVLTALKSALPDELEVLEPSKAEDKDSLNVTAEFAAEHDLVSIADLKGIGPFTVGANPEFQTRSYGIPGMERVYGITDAGFKAINDSGGPATLKALLDGTIQVADIYSTTPSILANKLVTLEDPKGMIAAQQVVPLISSAKASDAVQAVLDKVSAALTTSDLIQLNTRVSGDEKADPATAAEDWLEKANLF